VSWPVSLLAALVVLAALGAAIALWRARSVTIVYPPMVGLLYRDGRLRRELPPGRYTSFDPSGRTRIVQVSLAEMPAMLGEITVLTGDQFSFRLGLAPSVRVVEPRLYMESQPFAEQQHPLYPFMGAGANHPSLHPLLAAAAIETAGTMTLKEILADQKKVTDAVRAKLESAIPGAVVDRVFLTAINLPPETRRMFTDVERARMDAQAALERARGEQAALRVLANAARLITDNPALANLRLLQAIENSRGSTTIVFGNSAAPLAGLGVPAASSDPA